MIKDVYGNTRFFGIYRGVVADTADPMTKGRAKIVVPQILADNPTQWAWPVSGLEIAPKVGDGVWVLFEGGDPAYPLWVGRFNEIQTASIHPELILPANPSLKDAVMTIGLLPTDANNITVSSSADSRIVTSYIADLNTSTGSTSNAIIDGGGA